MKEYFEIIYFIALLFLTVMFWYSWIYRLAVIKEAAKNRFILSSKVKIFLMVNVLASLSGAIIVFLILLGHIIYHLNFA